MRSLKRLAIAAICGGALMLAGCATDGTGNSLDDIINGTTTDATALIKQIDDFIASQPAQEGITIACSFLNGGSAAWTTWTASKAPNATDAADAKAAMDGVKALCSGTNPQDTADAVNKVVTAAVAVLVDLHNEKARSPATAPATTSPAETTPDDATANSQ